MADVPALRLGPPLSQALLPPTLPLWMQWFLPLERPVSVPWGSGIVLHAFLCLALGGRELLEILMSLFFYICHVLDFTLSRHEKK